MNTIQAQMELKRIAQISDPILRSVLISTAENVEIGLKSGKINPTMTIGHTLPYGLRIDIDVKQSVDDKPIIFIFTYKLDQLQMKQWLIENPILCEGPLSFTAKGIEVVIPQGAEKLDKSGFSIDNREGDRDWLPLLEHPVSFTVHRNLFGGKEWECFYTDEQ